MTIARWSVWLGFVWLALVGVLSLLPLWLKRDLHTTGALHRAGHILAFAVAAFLFCQPKIGFLPKALRVVSLFVFALALETLQHSIYGNEFELPDVGMDAAGLLLGIAIASIAARGAAGRPGTGAF